MTTDLFRSALTRQKPALMAWVGSGVPAVVEQMGEAGYDAVLIDQQHGLTDHHALVNCLTAARAAGLPALVRPLSADAGLIGAALDAGAQGVVAPLIETAEDAVRVVRAASYPPRGLRSWGPYRGRFMIDGDYQQQANDWVVACAQIETGAAMDNLDAILSTGGLDMALVGPNDLALALTGKRDIQAREVTRAIARVLEKCREHGVIAAIFANDIDYARPLAEAGWDVVTVGTDMGLLAQAGAQVVRSLRG